MDDNRGLTNQGEGLCSIILGKGGVGVGNKELSTLTIQLQGMAVRFTFIANLAISYEGRLGRRRFPADFVGNTTV